MIMDRIIAELLMSIDELAAARENLIVDDFNQSDENVCLEFT